MFSYSPIDRQAQIRTDASQVRQLLESPESRFLVWHEGKLITRKDQTLYFRFNELDVVKKPLTESIYLGQHEKHSYFTFHLDQWHADFDGLELIELRSVSRIVTDYQLGLLFYSKGMLNWHRNHPFCSRCGGTAHIINAGHARQCDNPSCARTHYPKIDPAVIFSVVNNTGSESKILLGRQPSWEEFRYSVIAGFVEPGETFEDAVKREAYEETGLKIDKVSYVASQPWPFPDSLMVGFACETDQLEIRLIDQELEMADWFSAGDIEEKLASGQLKMPFSVSISWHLIDCWFTQQKGYSLTVFDDGR